MTTEAPVVKNVMMEASRIGLRLLRNNRGQFYTMDKKRIVRAGLEAPGSSDLIGITPVKITKEMVGITLGVFTAGECKKPGWTKPTDGREQRQADFITIVESFGGIGFFITDKAELAYKIAASIRNKITKKDIAVDTRSI